MNREAIRAARRARFLGLVAQEPLRPGVLALLQTARDAGVKLAVASSSDRAWVEGHLRERELLPFFALTRCSDDVTHTKPFPDLYISALAGLGVEEANRAVAIEDSPNGVRAAKAAGLFCVAFPNPMTRGLPAMTLADTVITSSLAELSLDFLNREKFGDGTSPNFNR